jgi:hypothetical protein
MTLLLYTYDYSGTGNFRTQIPMYKSIDGPDVVAIAEKLEGTNATLSVSVGSPELPQITYQNATSEPYGNATGSFAVSCQPYWFPNLC